MSQLFSPRLEILPQPQQRLWRELAQTPPHFVLYGGTALALHLGHRESIDFDFFSDETFEWGRLALTIPYLADATVTQGEPNTFSCFVDRDGVVKLSFFGLPWLLQISPAFVAQDNGLQVASLLDLAAAKASVVQQRAEAKDYLDIDALLIEGVDLPTILAAARAVHGVRFNPQITLKALSFFEDGNLHNLPRAVKDRLAKAARKVDLDGLPVLQATRCSPKPGPGPTT